MKGYISKLTRCINGWSKKLIPTLSFILICLVISVNSHAALISWTGAVDNDWNEPGNWSGNLAPTIADEVIIQGNFSVNIDNTINIEVGSLEIIDATLTIEVNSELTVYSLSVPTLGFALHCNNATIINNGDLFSRGGMLIENNSSITNNERIVDFGDQPNALYNFYIDTGSECINSSTGSWYATENVYNGVHKEAFIYLDNESTFVNYYRLYNQWSSTLESYLINGIILDNGSEFKNLTGFININWVQQRGVLLKNTNSNPIPTSFDNQVALRLRETTVDTDNTSMAIECKTNTLFTNSNSGYYTITLGTLDPSGFDNTTPVIDINGAFIYFSTSALPFLPRNLTLSPGSYLGGSGPIKNSQLEYLGGGLSPGASPGIITMQESFSPGVATPISMELAGTNSPGASDGHDQIVFESPTNDVSNIDLSIALIDGFNPTIGNQFMLFSGAYTGTFNSLDLPGGNSSWSVTYNSNDITIELLNTLQNVNNIGIGTDAPKSKLQVKEGDIYLETLGAGVIMKDANGDCRKLVIDGSGVISAVVVPCPQ